MSREQVQDFDEGGLAGVIQHGIRNYMKDVHTCLPGQIVSFDELNQTAEVQLNINRSFTDGRTFSLPVLVKVPVCFLRAGGFNITFPIAQNDECLVFFAERSIDRWFKFSGVQGPQDMRMHSLSDAFCIVGFASEPKAIANFDTQNFQIRNEEQDQTITLKPNKDIEIVTGTVEAKLFNGSETIDLVAPVKVNVTTPLAEFSENVTINGDLEVIGASDLSSTVTSNGVDISDTHKHSGVTTGGSNTGNPV